MIVTMTSACVVQGKPLAICLVPGKTDSVPATVELHVEQIDRVATRWKLSTSSIVKRLDEGFEAALSATDSLDVGGLYKLIVIAVKEPGGERGERIPTRPEALLFTVSEGDSDTWSASEVKSQVDAVLHERRTFFDQPLGDADAHTEYRAKILVAGLHLTTVLSYPGLQIQPLSLKRGPTWDGEILSEILTRSGWGVVVDLNTWSDHRLRTRPIALISIDRIRANSDEEAHATVVTSGAAVLDVLALRRGARGEIVGSAVQEHQDTSRALIAPHGGTYRGNLLGGFISGEDPHGFVTEVRAVLADSRLALLLSLHAEAEAEERLDFAYFRYWGILELVSMSHTSSGTTVSDFHGVPIERNGRTVVTGPREARANVYELLKQSFMAGSIGEKRPSVEGSGTLWEATGVWYGRRNATAHYGGFRPTDQAQKTRPWYLSALVAHELADQHGGQDRVHDRYFEWLRDSTKIILDKELLGKPMRP